LFFGSAITLALHQRWDFDWQLLDHFHGRQAPGDDIVDLLELE
jgi:hypothetical protein